jgi:hypothetical protein
MQVLREHSEIHDKSTTEPGENGGILKARRKRFCINRLRRLGSTIISAILLSFFGYARHREPHDETDA